MERNIQKIGKFTKKFLEWIECVNEEEGKGKRRQQVNLCVSGSVYTQPGVWAPPAKWGLF